MSNYQQSMIMQLYSQFSPAEGETVRQITVDELIDIAEFGDIYQLFYHPPGGLDITPSGNPKLYLHMRNFNEDTNRSEIVDLTN